ncbi:RfaG Glycosyltransferase [Caulobacteraceae bacterium]
MIDAGVYGGVLRSHGVEVVALDMRLGFGVLGSIVRMFRLIQEHKPDVVQTWMYHANLVGGVVARAAGIERVFWGIRTSKLERAVTRVTTLAIDRLCAWLSEAVPTGIISCADAATVAHIENGYCAEKFHTIPNGYEVGRYRPLAVAGRDFRQAIGVAPETPLLGMVGRWDPYKDHANLLAAVAVVRGVRPDVRCVLVGTGCTAESPGLVSLIDAHDLRGSVILLGPRSDVPAIMNGIDVHVLSSLGEAFPNVVAEAMACGTPCVATDVGDAVKIVGETGWIVPPRDAEGLARAILEALSESAAKDRWKIRTEDCVKRILEYFTLGRMIDNYNRVWNQSIGRATN